MPTPQPPRDITDSHVLAAMSHPLRRRLLDVLTVDGPATVSGLAARTGQAVGNVSHHVRVLAEAELIEEASGLARDRREHWWRLASPSLRWSTTSFEEDPASEAVARAAESLNLEHHVALVRRWQGAGESERAAWGQSPFATSKWLHLTPDELAELGGEMITLFERFAARGAADDGQRREPVFAFSFGVPAQP